jgi:CheY-specific phosphatase CheX
MQLRNIFLLIALTAVAAFAALNWTEITTPTTLSLGVAVVEAPLGLVMLGLLVFVTALFLAFMVYLQTSVLLEARRHARELQTNRTLADQAEASRFTELRSYLEGALQRQAEQDAASGAAVLARLDQLDRELRSAVEESGNTLTAYIGELEDRLEMSGKSLPPAT